MSQTTKNALIAYIKQATENVKQAPTLDDALFWTGELINARAELQKLDAAEIEDLNF